MSFLSALGLKVANISSSFKQGETIFPSSEDLLPGRFSDNTDIGIPGVSTTLDRIHLAISGPATITEVVWGYRLPGLYQGYGKYKGALVKYKLVTIADISFDPEIHLVKKDVVLFDKAIHVLKSDVSVPDPAAFVPMATFASLRGDASLVFSAIIFCLRAMTMHKDPVQAGKASMIVKDGKIAFKPAHAGATWMVLGTAPRGEVEGFYY